MAMKYVKGNQTGSMQDGVQGKMILTVDGQDRENIWVQRFDGYSVLLNHAINFFPFESWGAIIPHTGGEFDVSGMREKYELELHPEAWDQYIQNGLIDEQGNHIPPTTEPEEEDETPSINPQDN